MIYEDISENRSLRIKNTKIRLSDLLDPFVTWLKTSREVDALVGAKRRIRDIDKLDLGALPIDANKHRIRKKVSVIDEIGHSLNMTEGIWKSVVGKHKLHFDKTYPFYEISYEEALSGSCGNAHKFVLAANEQCGEVVPGDIYCWLVDIHARALRAHLKSVVRESEDRMWVLAFDKRSPFPAFGKGSRITYPEYLALVAKYRSLRDIGYPPVQPIATPDGWNIYRRQNETEFRSNNEDYRYASTGSC